MRPQNVQNDKMFSITQEFADNEHQQMNKLEAEEKEEEELSEYRSMILLGLGIVGILIPLGLLVKILSKKNKKKEHSVSG